MVFSVFCDFLLSRRILFNGSNGMNKMKDAFKTVITENNGHAFHVLNKLFWQTIIDSSLELTNGNKTKACEMLGISKTTLYEKIGMSE